MDVKPEVHPLPDLRGFLQLLGYIDAWDLALVEVANEGGVESRLRRDIQYSEVPPAALVLPVDCVTERKIDHQEPNARSACDGGKLIVDVHCLADFWLRRVEIRRRGHLATRSQHGVASLALLCLRAGRTELCPQYPTVENCRKVFEPLAPASVGVERD